MTDQIKRELRSRTGDATNVRRREEYRPKYA
jgi:hypothetical protein